MIREEAERRARLQALQRAGVDPYPARVSRTHTTQQVLDTFASLEKTGEPVFVVGRVRKMRRHGGVSFLQIEDGFGRIQIMVKIDELGEDAYTFMHDTLDIGDYVQVRGGVILTKTEEQSILATEVRTIAKAILPLPEKWHGLSDIETRFRHRSLDLIANPSVRETFRNRTRIVSAIRRFFDEHGFMEVDTPMLQHVAAGASAKPFATHHNALDQELYLRIAPELFLKRLVIGGYERVYEIARCFRNEGIDHSHNPEFTQVEAYVAYMDYEELMQLMEALVRSLIVAVGKDAASIEFDDHVLDFSKPFPRRTFRDLILEKTGIDTDTIQDREVALEAANTLGVKVEPTASLATILDELWKKTVRPTIIQPTFVIDYPAAITPLAKRKPDDPEHLEMFQLVLGGGLEVMKAFTELNDPVDQEERFNEQEEAHQKGDEEAQRRDDDFLFAMKHGMPPMAGMGMGIERITQVLTNAHNIKEVLLFPTLRRQAPDVDRKTK